VGGLCPLGRDLLKLIGFEIIAFDKDDTPFAHRMAGALGWDAQMDLENDLFGTNTLLLKRK